MVPPSLSRSLSCIVGGSKTGPINVLKAPTRQACRRSICCSRTSQRSAASSAAAEHTDMPATFSRPSLDKGKAIDHSGRTYGQPLPFSHPHLFPKRLSLSAGAGIDPSGEVALDELTPGIPASEYDERRRQLMNSLPKGSVVVAMSGRVKSMSGKITYRFRQESNFFYLTGFLEPDACLILEKNESSLKGYKMTMFVRARGDEQDEMWNGSRTGIDGVEKLFGADEAYELDPSKLLSHLKLVLPQCERVYVEPPSGPTVPRQSLRAGSSKDAGNIVNYLSPPAGNPFDLFARKTDFEAVVKLLQDSRKCESLNRVVDKMRFRKSKNELRLMKRAGDISAAAMTKAMGFAVEPGVTLESQIQAHFEYHCSLARGMGIKPAYVPVVASGSKGLTIHYINNDGVVQEGDLICMDAGAEVDGYASDITRAWPANGRFSGPQRDIYEALLRVLKGCTKLATESQCYSLTELHRRSVEMLTTELKDLGFGNLGVGMLERTLYPHYIGHWLGIDLHDTPTVERSTALQEGVVVTIEPGLYIPYDDRFPKHYQGIGIRVEDDVAVLKDGNIVLSANAPKEVVDVEAAFQRFFDAKHSHSQKQRMEQLQEEAQHATENRYNVA